jgi:hypothetical protein
LLFARRRAGTTGACGGGCNTPKEKSRKGTQIPQRGLRKYFCFVDNFFEGGRAKGWGPIFISLLPPPNQISLGTALAGRHLESRIEPKIAAIGVYITMRALQKPIRHTQLIRLHHFICKHKPHSVWFFRRCASCLVQCKRSLRCCLARTRSDSNSQFRSMSTVLRLATDITQHTPYQGFSVTGYIANR